MGETKDLLDFIDKNQLQTLQDRCSKAMGLAFVTVDYKGIPVTDYSGFTPYCTMGRKLQGFSEMCEQCDAHGGLHSAITGQPYIYRCHADLVDFAIPLILNNSYKGAILGGQVRLSDEEERELEAILPQKMHWREKNRELEQEYQNVRLTTYEKLEASVQVFRDVILYMIQNQPRQDAPSRPAEKKQNPPEGQETGSCPVFTMQQRERRTIQQQPGLRYFFFAMNVIARLAFQEKASRTETAVYDFSDVMRYTIDQNQKLSTLGEELNYISSLLHILKAWEEDNLTYHISVPDCYRDLSCPFMVFQPVVEAALIKEPGQEDTPRKVDIFAEEDGNALLLQVFSNNASVTLDEIEAQISGPAGEEDRCSLREANQNLRQIMGKNCGLSVGLRKDGQPGFCIRFHLPFQKTD